MAKAKQRPKHSDSGSGVYSPLLGGNPGPNIYVAGKTTPPQNSRYVTSGMLSGNYGSATFPTDPSGKLPVFQKGKVPKNLSNQTGFYKEIRDYGFNNQLPGMLQTQARLPEPQFIKNLPFQKAGYTDYPVNWDDDGFKFDSTKPKINKAGNISGGMIPGSIGSVQDFLNTKSVFVNPLYKDPYDKVGNDPDSKDRSRGPSLGISDQLRINLREIGEGTRIWAEATSKYFNKPIVVGKSPVFNQGSPLTTRVNIEGEYTKNNAAGWVYMSTGSLTPRPKKVLKAPGGENRVTKAGALQKTMTLNTNMGMGYNQMDSASTIQHEFGHTMGLNHPHEYPRGTTKNSELSYYDRGDGAKLGPSTINYYKNIMNMNLGYTGVEKLKKAKEAQQKALIKQQLTDFKYKYFGQKIRGY